MNVPERVRNALERLSGRPGEHPGSGVAGDTGSGSDRGVRERLPSVTRRRVLAGILGIGAAKATDNVLVGYGVLTGTNLLEQDLQALATERLGPSPFTTTIAGTEFALAARVLHVDGDEYPLEDLSPADARTADREHGFASGDERGPIEELAADWPAITNDPASVEVRPQSMDAFFETIFEVDARPVTVAALRGSEYEPATPETVAAFTDVGANENGEANAPVDASDPEAIVHGLKEGFDRRTSYDVHRYAAGSVEDNVIMGAADLRDHFESPTTFDALLAGETTGMFCYEFVFRSIDALHAVAADRQTAPVFAGVVTDVRHKHVYTTVASAYREDDALVVPLTFVDYTHSTLYDDYAADVVLGEGLNAYDARHHATELFWNGYVGAI